MTTLTKGLATRNDIDTLIATANITEALYRLGYRCHTLNYISESIYKYGAWPILTSLSHC